jgi:HPt (histidine-containing phosphotransfer) domain-containing protein
LVSVLHSGQIARGRHDNQKDELPVMSLFFREPVVMFNMKRPSHESTDAADRAAADRAAAGCAAGDQILDGAALDRLRELDPTGAAGLLPRVLSAFETSVARLLPELAQARANGDLQAIGRVAHTLKSSSASIGALRLSALCAECEQLARESRGEGMEEGLDEIVAQTSIAVVALKKVLDQRP